MEIPVPPAPSSAVMLVSRGCPTPAPGPSPPCAALPLLLPLPRCQQGDRGLLCARLRAPAWAGTGDGGTGLLQGLLASLHGAREVVCSVSYGFVFPCVNIWEVPLTLCAPPRQSPPRRRQRRPPAAPSRPAAPAPAASPAGKEPGPRQPLPWGPTLGLGPSPSLNRTEPEC